MEESIRSALHRQPLPAGSSAGPLVLAWLLLWGALACASAPPPGPIFSPAPSPGESRALLYLYRFDQVASRGAVRVRIDGLETHVLYDQEYLWLHVRPGLHSISTLWSSGWSPSSGWNDLRVNAPAGRTTYLKLYTAYEEIDRAPGRAQAMVTPNMFGGVQPRSQAEGEIARCTLAVGERR
jgi:hypothetical protein